MEKMTRAIEFTQYLRPNGRPVAVRIERPDSVVDAADRLRAAGYKFEIEVLMSGHVSMSIEPTDDDELDEHGPLATEICGNGPAVPTAVDKMIADAADALLAAEKRGAL